MKQLIIAIICMIFVILMILSIKFIRRENYDLTTTEADTSDLTTTKVNTITEQERPPTTAITSEISATEKTTVTQQETEKETPTTEEFTTCIVFLPAAWSTDEELYLISSVVMNEAGYECYDGKIAVAQCIRNACLKENQPFSAIRYKYGYKYTKTPTEEVKKAVNDVFLYGITVTDEPILYYYAPALTYSAWHESQVYVMTIGGHKFFKER